MTELTAAQKMANLIVDQKNWFIGLTVRTVLIAAEVAYFAVTWYQGTEEKPAIRLMEGTVFILSGILLLAIVICLILCSMKIKKTREIVNSGMLGTAGSTEENCRHEWQAFTTGMSAVLSRLTRCMVFVLLPVMGLLAFHMLYG